MDPLSITAGVIAVATVAVQACNKFAALRAVCTQLPGTLHKLNNEITDLSAVLNDVIAVFTDERRQQLITEDEQQRIPRVTDRAKKKLLEISAVVDTLAAACEKSKIPLQKVFAWQKVQGKLGAWQTEVTEIKCTLNLMIGASHSRDLLHIRTDIKAIIASSELSIQMQSAFREDLLEEMAAQHDTLVEQFEESIGSRVVGRLERIQETLETQGQSMYEDQATRLGPRYGGPDAALVQKRRLKAASSASPTIPSGQADAIGVRLSQFRTACNPGCPCACHTTKKSKPTPALLDRFIGQLFVGYTGLPALGPKCNNSICKKSQSPHVSLEYWFPVGVFWSQIVRLQLGYEPNVGPQMQLSMLRRVPDSAQCVDFALNGNIEGLKVLFRQGMASPRDVSATRGYSLLRWALYGKQYEACTFLLQQGADPDYRPIAAYDNSPKNKAHDFLLQGNLTSVAEETLRGLTRGSDWIDEQNYTLLHKSVLGLSFTPLKDAILQHPEDIDTADAMYRTPLSWAAARGDAEAVALLLGAGADPNTMDIQVSGPLSNAADRGHTTVCRLLLEHGALPDPIMPPGIKTGSPLNCAARNTHDPLCIKTLLDFGADTESCGVDGKTSLIHVARTDNAAFALLLLEYRANINAATNTGQTALTTAIINNSHKVLQLLLDRWTEYSECPRLKGPHLLEMVALYADIETIQILTATDHLKLSFDRAYGSRCFRKHMRERFDYSEKLMAVYEDLMDVINHEPQASKSDLEGLLESGLFHDLCMSEKDECDSDDLHNDDDFHDAFESILSMPVDEAGPSRIIDASPPAYHV